MPTYNRATLPVPYREVVANRFTRRPWLRYLEGTEGNQAGGSGTPPAGESVDQGKGGDVGDGKTTGGQQQANNTGGTEKPAEKTAPPSTTASQSKEPETKTSEPAPKQDAQADADDSSKVKALETQVAEMGKTIQALTQAEDKRTQEQHLTLSKEVAKKFGLPESAASRLQGTTRQELEDDATALAKDLGLRVVDPTQGRGAGGSGRPITMADAIQAKIAAAGLK